VWFFSLDADLWPVVALARQAFRLPYYKAHMRVQRRDDTLLYQSYRRHPGAADAVFRGAYRASGEAAWHSRGSLEYFLTERYYLYTQGGAGQLYRAAVQHPPWPLQAAEAEITSNTMAQGLGLQLPDTAPLLHYTHRMDVLTWSLQRL
jgi:uncharacterized protein YqjF (DUF2071 family)